MQRAEPAAAAPESGTVSKFRERLRDGQLEDKLVEVNVSDSSGPAIEIFSGQSFEEMDINLGNLGNLFGGRKKKKKVPVRRARQVLMAEEIDRLVDKDRVSELAIERVEQMGIIFLDEIDKVASKDSRGGVDVSREGVQRDILPIVEGSTVTTKWGTVDTAHILFIAAGAFHMSKPADLIPELQGRFPIRVELAALGSDDFKRILTQPRNALITQYTALLATEEVDAEVHRGRGRQDLGTGLRGESQHREYRRPAPAHDHGAAARGAFLQRPRLAGAERHHHSRLRERAAHQDHRGPRPHPLHPVASAVAAWAPPRWRQEDLHRDQTGVAVRPSGLPGRATRSPFFCPLQLTSCDFHGHNRTVREAAQREPVTRRVSGRLRVAWEGNDERVPGAPRGSGRPVSGVVGVSFRNCRWARWWSLRSSH